MAKVKYNGIELHSSVQNETLRPVWNQYMHFPVIFGNPEVLKNPTLVKTVLPLDMLMRGTLKVEIWHWNGSACADLIGTCEVDLNNLSRFSVERIRYTREETYTCPNRYRCGTDNSWNKCNLQNLGRGGIPTFVNEQSEDYVNELGDVPPTPTSWGANEQDLGEDKK